jgi:hypothetical protein
MLAWFGASLKPQLLHMWEDEQEKSLLEKIFRVAIGILALPFIVLPWMDTVSGNGSGVLFYLIYMPLMAGLCLTGSISAALQQRTLLAIHLGGLGFIVSGNDDVIFIVFSQICLLAYLILFVCLI